MKRLSKINTLQAVGERFLQKWRLRNERKDQVWAPNRATIENFSTQNFEYLKFPNMRVYQFNISPKNWIKKTLACLRLTDRNADLNKSQALAKELKP